MVASIIRWAGSKKKLLPSLVSQIPKDFDRYVEPFCGSACLFFEIQPREALLSDINPELTNAWEQIRLDPKIRNELVVLPSTKDFYYETRSKDAGRLSNRERAIRFLYLNRKCFNGVYRTNKKGLFNVPMGTRTGDFPSQEVFDEASEALKSAIIKNLDYFDVIKQSKRGDFFYMDPPYTTGGRFTGEYGVDSFSSLDLPRLFDAMNLISERGAKFMLSYKASEETVSFLESSYTVNKIKVKRHVQGFKSNWGECEEIIVRNYEL